MKSVLLHLAGSIESNGARDWRTALMAALPHRNVTITPPCVESVPRAQIEWELDCLDRADIVAMWFAADTVAPIALLELGLTATSDKLVVGCPDGFWRKGNIEVVCSRFGIPLTTSWAAFVALVRAKLEHV